MVAEPLASNPDARLREIHALRVELDSIRERMLKGSNEARTLLDAVQSAHRVSAENLIHYLALRERDLRGLQPRLSALGLSSLGRSEARVLPSVDAVRIALNALDTVSAPGTAIPAADAGQQELLAAHTQALLGSVPDKRRVRIMVTMPTEAAHDYALVHELVRAGMDCMRINCAHDSADVWLKMVEHQKRACEALGRSCRIAMDLGGPKLRTGPLERGAAVVKARPERDDFGRVTAPARVWLASMPGGRAAPSLATAALPVQGAWLAHFKVGDRITFTDARGARREMDVADVSADGVWAELSKTAYFVPGMVLRRAGARGKVASAPVEALEGCEQPLLVKVGDALVITRDLKPGRAATFDKRGRVLTPASIGCTLPEVFEDVRCGERIWLDDGKIGGLIERVEADRVVVKIDRARARGEKLRGDKGINLPDSKLRLPALSQKDIQDLEFVVRHADIVSLSFANSAADVDSLQQHLKRLGAEHLGIILKIETRRGFEHLPEMLFAALRSARCGVMIARGDLAVECGFERLAELQEEILWICEAGHVPVIWATEVLERLAKQGVASRAEITDAAMSERAECVMLNKGPYILKAVGVLDDILRRMQSHVTKKRSMLRELQLARRFFRQDPS
jgi:pyruvate kinase